MARQTSIGSLSPKAPPRNHKIPSLPNAQSNLTGASTQADGQEDEQDGEADNSKDKDADDDELGPLTSPLAARTQRASTPLTIANLAKVDAAQEEENEWAKADDTMFNEQQAQDSQGSDSSDIEVADDDEDYDGVDNISQASDTPSDESRQFEADVEREIQAAGESAIDWDNSETYQYNAAFSEYSFATYALDANQLDSESDVFSSTFQQPAVTPAPTSPRPFQDEFLKGTPLDPLENEWPSSSSENDDDDGDQNDEDKQNGLVDDQLSDAASSAEEDMSDDEDADDDIESSDNSTDDGQPILDHIKTPSITLANTHSPNLLAAQSEPPIKRRSMAAPETPLQRRQPGKFSAMKRLKLAPHQAIAYARSSPQGRIVCFTQPREGHFRFVSARTSRSSSMDSGNEIQDPVLRARFVDACKSVLFRRQVCTPSSSHHQRGGGMGIGQSPLSSSSILHAGGGMGMGMGYTSRSSAMLASPFASSSFHLNHHHHGHSSSRGMPLDDTIASSIEEDDVSNLIDFDGNGGEEEDDGSGGVSSSALDMSPGIGGLGVNGDGNVKRNLQKDLMDISMPPPPPINTTSTTAGALPTNGMTKELTTTTIDSTKDTSTNSNEATTMLPPRTPESNTFPSFPSSSDDNITLNGDRKQATTSSSSSTSIPRTTNGIPETPSPKKRRVTEVDGDEHKQGQVVGEEYTSTLTPAMKKQRV